MGVILKVLHRCEKMGKQRFRNLFLDMEENIHIHYRDLRIELSRKEFEDIVNTFAKQSKELMDIITSKNYQDGVLPNANHDDVRIWTESRLENEVVYHPKRLSIEECTDGYHIHFRNYKLLLDRDDFTVFTNAFKNLEIDGDYTDTAEGVAELFEANHMHYKVLKSEDKYGKFLVAGYHEVKARSVLKGIGLTRTGIGTSRRYEKGDLVIDIEITRRRSDFADQYDGVTRPMTSVTEALLSRKDDMDPDWLNGLKARILDTFESLEKNPEHVDHVNLDYRTWVYDELYEEVVFPFRAGGRKQKTNFAYRDWMDFLKEHNLYFVKPTKTPLTPGSQKKLRAIVNKRLMEQAAKVPEISKIHIMGSINRRSMGIYKQPFIHSRWAKIASDVDILIELADGTTDFKAPEAWNYVNHSTTNDCDIYHIGQIPATDLLGHKSTYPNIKFFDHLLDAYVFIPGVSDPEQKDAFLKKFAAVTLFDRAQNEVMIEDLKGKIEGEPANLHRMDVATENEIYGLDVDDVPAILKVYRVSGNYSSDRLHDHAVYEVQVTNGLVERGVPIAKVLPTKSFDSVFEFDSAPALLFERLIGDEIVFPPYPTVECAKALAVLHAAQLDNPIKTKNKFSFDHTFKMWHVEFERFRGETKADTELATCFDKLAPIHADMENIYGELNKRKLPKLHNHGDVQPRNIIMRNGTPVWFDLQNAFYGSRLYDIVDGAIEFSWGFKRPEDTDFARFDEFVNAYKEAADLSAAEETSFDDVLRIYGLIEFIKEVRMIKGDTNINNLRRRRAVDLANFMLTRVL